MITVIGVDPGPTTGICLLRCDVFGDGRVLHSPPDVVQCSPHMVDNIIAAIPLHPDTLIAVERFVVGRKSMRAGRDGEITRDLVGALEDTYGFHLVLQNAVDVKRWATDPRLDAAGLLAPTTGMRHARDGARHALYAAVKHLGYPDPLSRKAVQP